MCACVGGGSVGGLGCWFVSLKLKNMILYLGSSVLFLKYTCCADGGWKKLT